MDYASEIDSHGNPVRRKQRGGWSFLVIAIGTVCLIAAWILTANDPYTDLANRVVEFRAPDDAGAASPQGGAAPLSGERVAAQGPIGLLPDEMPADGAGDEAAFREMIESLPPATASAGEAVESDPARATPQNMPYSASPSRSRDIGSEDGPITVPVQEFAGPPEAADQAEADATELTRAQRRAVQRRLRMAGHDAGPPDGVFGPMTREAVAGFQEAVGLTATGELDEITLAELKERTDADYAAWAESRGTISLSRSSRADEGEIDLSQAGQRQRPGGDGCARDADGSIIPNQGFGCDLRGLLGSGAPGRVPFEPGVDR